MFLFLSSVVIEGTSTFFFFKNNEKQLPEQILTNLHTKKQFLIYLKNNPR